MNEEVRAWIVSNRQLWSMFPDLSYLGGPIGADGVREPSPAVDFYFKFHGMETTGRFIEDLGEQETLQQYELVLRWLPDEAAAWFERNVGFGLASTMEANALATRCPHGLAILYDISLDFALSAMLELWCATFVLKQSWDDQVFADKLTNVVLSRIFHLCAPERTAAIDIPRRMLLDQLSWGQGLFVIAHEVAHVFAGHLGRESRLALGSTADPNTSLKVLARSHRQEHEADNLAIGLLILGNDKGLARPGTNVWPAMHRAISLFFTLLSCIEKASERIGLALPDSHPPSEVRRHRTLSYLREIVPSLSADPDDEVHQYFLRGIERGALPEVDTERLERHRRIRALINRA